MIGYLLRSIIISVDSWLIVKKIGYRMNIGGGMMAHKDRYRDRSDLPLTLLALLYNSHFIHSHS